MSSDTGDLLQLEMMRLIARRTDPSAMMAVRRVLAFVGGEAQASGNPEEKPGTLPPRNLVSNQTGKVTPEAKPAVPTPSGSEKYGGSSGLVSNFLDGELLSSQDGKDIAAVFHSAAAAVSTGGNLLKTILPQAPILKQASAITGSGALNVIQNGEGLYQTIQAAYNKVKEAYDTPEKEAAAGQGVSLAEDLFGKAVSRIKGQEPTLQDIGASIPRLPDFIGSLVKKPDAGLNAQSMLPALNLSTQSLPSILNLNPQSLQSALNLSTQALQSALNPSPRSLPSALNLNPRSLMSAINLNLQKENEITAAYHTVSSAVNTGGRLLKTILPQASVDSLTSSLSGSGVLNTIQKGAGLYQTIQSAYNKTDEDQEKTKKETVIGQIASLAGGAIRQALSRAQGQEPTGEAAGGSTFRLSDLGGSLAKISEGKLDARPVLSSLMESAGVNEKDTPAVLHSVGAAANTAGSFLKTILPKNPIISLFSSITGMGKPSRDSEEPDQTMQAADDTVTPERKKAENIDTANPFAFTRPEDSYAEINKRLGDLMRILPSLAPSGDAGTTASYSGQSGLPPAGMIRPLAAELWRLMRESAINEHNRRGWY